MSWIAAVWAGLLIVGPASAQRPPALPAIDGPGTFMDPLPAAPDYASAASWLCRPGVDDGTCTAGLDAIRIDAKGDRTPAPFVPARAPAIDCFYVYPTVSNDPGTFSDLTPGPEERRTTKAQAGRLGSVCRLFVPLYRQFTMTALRRELGGETGQRHADALPFDTPYRDVLAAWRSYLARDNQGRGVILLGHSQGAILLKRLLAEEIDGKPVQRRLVGAYLAGNPDLTASSLHAIPPCAALGQTGCIVAWSDYRDGDTSAHRAFGAGKPGDPALCVNPASPGGGRGLLKSYMSKPAMAPPGDPPFIEVVGQESAACETDAAGTVLRIRVEPGPYADILSFALDRMASRPGWGLHPLDINLVQGNILDMVAAQSAAWSRR